LQLSYLFSSGSAYWASLIYPHNNLSAWVCNNFLLSTYTDANRYKFIDTKISNRLTTSARLRYRCAMPIPTQLVGHTFTSANAAQMALRRAELQRQRRNSATLALVHNEALNDFNTTRLLRVREQLTKLDAMIEAEKDAQKLDRLASASSKLSEQERILDGRPLPGSRRPTSDKVPRTWVELQPALPQVATSRPGCAGPGSAGQADGLGV